MRRHLHSCRNQIELSLSGYSKRYESSSAAVESALRLSKVVAGTGLCSRREAEEWIKSGRVMVNGNLVSSVTQFVTIGTDAVYVDGMKIKAGETFIKPRLWIAHKMQGELVALTDPLKKRPLLFDRLKTFYNESFMLKPVSRLEFNTEGLILLTNSGDIARYMDDPLTGLKRHYRVKVHGKLTESKLDGFRRGPVVDGVKYQSMDVTVDHNSGTLNWIRLTLCDNKTRAVRTVCEHLNLQVARMICVGFGSYRLDTMPPETDIIETKLTRELQSGFHKHIISHRKKKH
eukprot:gene12463-26213_t